MLAACDEPGASISAVALGHGLNANLVHKWRRGRGVKRTDVATSSGVAAAKPVLTAEARFLPIEMSKSATASAGRSDTAARDEATPTIDIELHRGAASLGIRWPVSAAGECAAWLREVAAGLVK